MADYPYCAPLFPSSDPLPPDFDDDEVEGNKRISQRGQRFKWSQRLEHVIARLKAKRPNHNAKDRLQCFREEVDC